MGHRLRDFSGIAERDGEIVVGYIVVRFDP